MRIDSQLARWLGLLRLAGRRVLSPASRTESRRTLASVAGVALPVALMLVVTGVSLGLVSGSAVGSPDADYWVVPETGTASSAAVSVDGPRLGNVHAASDRLNGLREVTDATPVLLELVRVDVRGNHEYVLAVGLIPGPTPAEVAGVSAAPLTQGDPHFGNGDYDGPRTGEAVLSPAAAELLGASRGDDLEVVRAGVGSADAVFTAVAVSDPGASPAASLPVVLVHLSELQAITGAADGDRADQLLVRSSAPDARSVLAAVFPDHRIVSRSGLGAADRDGGGLPLALGAAALLVAVGVGVLFSASTMGMLVVADSRTSAVLAALGFSGRSRAALVSCQALLVALIGGVVGVALGLAGIEAANALVTRFVVDVAVARSHPSLVAYGLGVSLLIGLLTVPYLVVVTRRATTMEDLRR